MRVVRLNLIINQGKDRRWLRNNSQHDAQMTVADPPAPLALEVQGWDENRLAGTLLEMGWLPPGLAR